MPYCFLVQALLSVATSLTTQSVLAHEPTKVELPASKGQGREYLRGKYHCTIDLLFDLFGLDCFENKNN
jgi:hypothetical protein